ncbi:MAG: HepT-like ribonuclease domain-containing protein [Candidatus Nanopelagicales bacterium]
MRRELLLLHEIVAACNRAIDIAARHAAGELATSLDARDALLWNLTVVGEATGQLPAGVRDGHPDIPWNQPVRLRNRIVHGYWSVDLDVLHSVAVQDLPGFVAQVEALAATIAVES